MGVQKTGRRDSVASSPEDGRVQGVTKDESDREEGRSFVNRRTIMCKGPASSVFENMKEAVSREVVLCDTQ